MNAEEIMDWYLAHNAKELRKISDQLLKSKMSGAWARLGLSQKDEDDFYSIANMVLWDVSKKWDGKRDFRGLLWSALSNKFASEFRFRNQQKREKDRELLSFDAILTEDGGNLEEVEWGKKFNPTGRDYLKDKKDCSCFKLMDFLHQKSKNKCN